MKIVGEVGLKKIRLWAKKNIDLIPAFILPVAIFLLVMVALDIYPFGERSINNLDLYHQYLPIMSELQRKLHSGSSIFYSFNGGLGTNFYSLSTYQNASPLTWIFLALFSEEHIVICAIALILVKIGLISMSMNWYLRDSSASKRLDSTKRRITANKRKATEKRDTADRTDTADRLVKIVLSALFALSGYVVGYYTNLMWLDAIILTPLCIAGLKRSMDNKGSSLYIVSLALLLFTNYYIGALVCVFIVLYFFAYFFGERKTGLAKTAARTLGNSAISVLMSMVVLLPTAIVLRKTEHFETIGSGFSNLLRQSIPDHVAQLLPASNVTVLDGPPNLYAGLICLLLLVLYALRKNIDKRKRAIRISLIACVFISTNLIPLDLVWHFMHTPFGFPARYSFLLAFLLIETASETLEYKGSFEKKDIAKAFIFVALLYIVAVFGNEWDGMDKRFMYIIGVILIVLYAFVLLVMQSESGQIRKGLLTAVILFEIVTVTFRGIGAGNIAYTEKYLLFQDEVSQFIELVEKKSPYSRIELLGSENDMPPYVYGFRGASIFASSVPKSTYDTLKAAFPSGHSTLNIFTFQSIDAENDSRFGIRYYISIDGEIEGHPELIEVSRSGECFLYENPYPGAIGYMLFDDDSEEGAAKSSVKSLKDFAKKEDFANKEEFNTDIKLDIETMDGNRLTGSIDAPEDGILFITIPHEDGWDVKLDDSSVADFEAIDGFISFPIEKGTHQVEMEFTPPGFIAGAIISILGFTAFLLSFYRTKHGQS